MNKDTHSIHFTQKDGRILKLIEKHMDVDYVSTIHYLIEPELIKILDSNEMSYNS